MEKHAITVELLLRDHLVVEERERLGRVEGPKNPSSLAASTKPGTGPYPSREDHSRPVPLLVTRIATRWGGIADRFGHNVRRNVGWRGSHGLGTDCG